MKAEFVFAISCPLITLTKGQIRNVSAWPRLGVSDSHLVLSLYLQLTCTTAKSRKCRWGRMTVSPFPLASSCIWLRGVNIQSPTLALAGLGILGAAFVDFHNVICNINFGPSPEVLCTFHEYQSRCKRLNWYMQIRWLQGMRHINTGMMFLLLNNRRCVIDLDHY